MFFFYFCFSIGGLAAITNVRKEVTENIERFCASRDDAPDAPPVTSDQATSLNAEERVQPSEADVSQSSQRTQVKKPAERALSCRTVTSQSSDSKTRAYKPLKSIQTQQVKMNELESEPCLKTGRVLAPAEKSKKYKKVRVVEDQENECQTQ